MRYKQQHTNSCGAVALMCAASELGVDTMPALQTGGAGVAARGFDGGDFVVCPRTEDALYWVTSGQTMTKYSMPDHLVHCVRLLGLDVEVHKIPGVYTAMFDVLYADVVARCRGMGVPILPTAPSPLLATQRELVVVSTFAVGLHYVMRRHDGTYMDPADGGDHRSFDALNTWDKCYQTTGLSFVITTNEVNGDDLRRLFSD